MCMIILSTSMVLFYLLLVFVVSGAFKSSVRTRSYNTMSTLRMRQDDPIRGVEWARKRGMEPGFGGIWPGDPNAKKYSVTIRSKSTGQEYKLNVPVDRYIYHYFEEQGVPLPIVNEAKMCRQGCCTICTAKLVEGRVKMDSPLGLLKEFRSQYALTCCAYPSSDIVAELQDEDETYIRQWSEGFEGGGKEWGGFLPDDD